jgi:hypothetical protein
VTVRPATAVALTVLLLAGCGGSTDPRAITSDTMAAPFCGLEPPADLGGIGRVPAELVVGGARLVAYEDTSHGFRASLFLDATVSEVLAEYQQIAADQGWTVGAVDDEGFEAELYATTPGGALSVTIRRSGGCEHAITVGLEQVAGTGSAPS